MPYNNDGPFSLPDDIKSEMPKDYPQLDTNLDPHEAYDEGLDDLIDDNPYALERGVPHFWDNKIPNSHNTNARISKTKQETKRGR